MMYVLRTKHGSLLDARLYLTPGSAVSAAAHFAKSHGEDVIVSELETSAVFDAIDAVPGRMALTFHHWSNGANHASKRFAQMPLDANGIET